MMAVLSSANLDPARAGEVEGGRGPEGAEISRVLVRTVFLHDLCGHLDASSTRSGGTPSAWTR